MIRNPAAAIDSLGDIGDVDLTGLADGYIVYYDSATGLWKCKAEAAGVSTFLGLTDTPATFAAQALKLPRVNSGESALEFMDIAMVIGSVLKSWMHFDWFFGSSGWTDSTGGSASIARGPYYQTMNTGTTSGSRAASKITVAFVTNYLQVWVAQMPVNTSVGYFANSTSWIGFVTTYNNPSDTEKHYAFKIINGDIYASCADGSTQNIEDTGVNLDPTDAQRVLLVRPYYSGSAMSKIEYYIDGVLTNTLTSNLPDSGAGMVTYFTQTTINTAAALQLFYLYPFDIFMY